MPNIVITEQAHKAIKSFAEGEWTETGTRLHTGMWRVPVTFEVFERLKAKAFSSETFSDVIIRLAEMAKTKGKLQ